MLTYSRYKFTRFWAVYDADRFPEAAAKPVGERFVNCPWGLYHIDVAAS